MSSTANNVARRALSSIRYRAARRTRTWPGRRDGTLGRMWVRQQMNRSIEDRLLATGLGRAMEISGDYWARLDWASYETTSFPAFDICDPPAENPNWGACDVVICDQVLEHVPAPVRGAETVRRLLKPGGLAVVSTPFLIRVHPQPGDYWRFTEDGLRILLEQAGFERIETASWGNRRAVIGNLRRWPPHARWRSLRNEALFPLNVWAFAHAPPLPDRR